MNETLKRIITGLISGIIFLGIFFYNQNAFSISLLLILIFILIFEWPKLISPKTIKFWLITPFYPILPFLALIFLNQKYQSTEKLIAIYPFLIACSFDTIAYFIGSNFGKHKMCPSISPKKSWEGFGAGFIIILAINLFFFKTKFLVTLILSLLLSFTAFFGDLLESFIKRKAKVKDSGSILPGHGGLLDRFDSVIIVGTILALFSLLS